MVFLSQLTRRLTRLNQRIQRFKPYQAGSQTFTTLFPFVLIGAFMQGLELSVFEPDGFFASVYRIDEWFPFYDDIRPPLVALTTIIVYLTTLLGIFLFSRELAHLLKDDAQIVGGCALLVLLLFNFNYGNLDQVDFQNILSFNNFGLKNLFLNLLIGVIVAYSYHGLIKLNRWFLPKKLKTMKPATPMDRSLKAVIPLSVILIIAICLSYLLNFSRYQSINDLFYRTLNIPIATPTKGWIVLLAGFWHNFLTFLGLPGPLDYLGQSVSNTVSIANLNHALSTKNLMNVPYPTTLHTLYDTYGNFGGSGMTLALILIILIVVQKTDLRQIAKFSLLPSLVNLNDPILFGLPIFFNPILMIPYLLAPLVSMTIAWLFTIFKWLPAAVYAVPGTTPSFLLGFLGTNGNPIALLVSLLCLGSSMLIYYPFVKLLLSPVHSMNQVKEHVV